jgi:uncharacterized alkaline shock family protein YloU
MRFFTVTGIVFYTVVLFFIAGIIIIFSLNWIQAEEITMFLGYLQATPQSRLIVGLSGLLLILINISFAQIMLGKIQKERTIAFTNPSGEVSIALSAVEDLIKRLTAGIGLIKESRPDVIATKKNIEINLRLVLRSEVNIPELTGRLQEMIKNKVQETLGIDEQIAVKIHIAKIISEEDRKKKDTEQQQQEKPYVPFSGYAKT